MSSSRRVAILSLIAAAILSAPPISLAQDSLASQLEAESIAIRRAAAQQKLDALGAADAEGEEQPAVAETRSTLAQILSTLSSIELAVSTREQFAALVEAMPERLKELALERRTLEQQGAPPVEQASRERLDAIARDRDAVQETIDRLIQESNTGEVRVGAIGRQRGGFDDERERLQKSLRDARDRATGSDDPALARLRVELAELRLAEVELNAAALQSERNWLLRRSPLHDESLRVARLRLRNVVRDLQVLESALGQDLEQRREDLRSSERELSRQLDAASDPLEREQLALRLETLRIRRKAAEISREHAHLAEQIDLQEERSARVRRNLERLVSLVERQAQGEGIARRLLVLLGRLDDARLLAGDQTPRELRERLPALSEELFRIDDAIYEFDDEMEDRHERLGDQLASLGEGERARVEQQLDALADEKRSSLREHQEALGRVVDDINSLLALAQAHRVLIDDVHSEALAKMFWIRNAEPLNRKVVVSAIGSVTEPLRRLAELVSVESKAVRSMLSGGPRWLLVSVLCALLPWLAVRAYRWLGRLAALSLAEQTARGEPPGLNPALGILAQAAVWPLYVSLLVWVRQRSLVDLLPPIAPAAFDAVRTSALILGVFLFGRHLFGRDGWGERFWELSPKLCAVLRRALLVGSAAALFLLVPRQVLLAAPGGLGDASGGMPLERLLFVAFQLVALGLVGDLGRRNAPLMQKVLAASREHDGPLWRMWPLIHAGVLGGLIAILALDLLGMRFAATRLWSQTFGSMAVIVVLRLVVAVYVLLLLQRLVALLSDRARRFQRRDGSMEESTGRAFAVMRVSINAASMALAFVIVLEIWGLRVWQAITSPLAFQIVTRGGAALAIAGVAVVLGQLSRAIADSVLQPRNRRGVTLEAGRKLRTLAPLVQTTFNVVITFLAVAGVLRVIGVDTAPILAGIGIAGLAVGFAAQSLIKDLINGLFILFEDSLSIGDIVKVGGRGGLVERVTLRAVTVRDLEGHVHVIPNGTIDVVTNMTKGFSRYLLDVGVSYREDTDEVVAILREVDEEMRGEPEYGSDMLEPIEILGVDRFADSAVIVRARLKTRPIQQWRVGREFNRRMKKVFDERGVEIPFPHRTLYWGEPKDGAQPPIGVAVTTDDREHGD